MPASRSLIALLIGTVAFFALYMFALKGNSSNSSSSSQGLGQYQSAINKAHQAVQTSGANDAASGNDGTGAQTSTPAASGGASASHSTTTASSSTSPSSPHPATGPRHASKAHAARKPVVHLTPKVARHSHAALVRLSTVQAALAAHKTLVMLFYNPQGSDDQAVMHELAGVPTLGGSVVKLSIPLSEAANFTPVTQQVPVNFSPTVVMISPDGKAQEILGLVDGFVLAQYVRNDVLSSSK